MDNSQVWSLYCEHVLMKYWYQGVNGRCDKNSAIIGIDHFEHRRFVVIKLNTRRMHNNDRFRATRHKLIITKHYVSQKGIKISSN